MLRPRPAKQGTALPTLCLTADRLALPSPAYAMLCSARAMRDRVAQCPRKAPRIAAVPCPRWGALRTSLVAPWLRRSTPTHGLAVPLPSPRPAGPRVASPGPGLAPLCLLRALLGFRSAPQCCALAVPGATALNEARAPEGPALPVHSSGALSEAFAVLVVSPASPSRAQRSLSSAAATHSPAVRRAAGATRSEAEPVRCADCRRLAQRRATEPLPSLAMLRSAQPQRGFAVPSPAFSVRDLTLPLRRAATVG